MTAVETMVTISMNLNGMSLEVLEEKIGQHLQEAGQELLR